jgi:hypothetical protein
MRLIKEHTETVKYIVEEKLGKGKVGDLLEAPVGGFSIEEWDDI